MEYKIDSLLVKVDDLQEQYEDGRGKELAFEEIKLFIIEKNLKKWTHSAELLLKKYILLGVELKRASDIKLGLSYYGKVSFSSNANSQDNLLGLLMDHCESQVKTAEDEFKEKQKQFKELSPAVAVLLKASGATHEERLRDTLVKPVIKFSMDCYRLVMDLTKSFSSLEDRYHNAARRAMEFCKDYNEKDEFSSISNYMKKQFDIHAAAVYDEYSHDMIAEKTLELHIETRFRQLETTFDMKNYNGIVSVLNYLCILLKKLDDDGRPKYIKRYYRLLEQFYWISHNEELHAFTWYQMMNQLSDEAPEKKKAANNFLMGVICSPVDRSRSDTAIEKQTRLSKYAFMREEITNGSLLQDVENSNAMQFADDIVIQLYHLVTDTFDPMTLCENVEKLMSNLKPSLVNKYGERLQQVIASRFLLQIAQVYDNISFEELQSYFGSYLTMAVVEERIILLNQRKFFSAVMNHREKQLSFGSGVYAMESKMIRNIFYEVVTAIHTSVNLLTGSPTYENELSELTSVVREKMDEEFDRVREMAVEEDRYEELLKQKDERLEKKLENIVNHHKNLQKQQVQKQKELEAKRAEALRQAAELKALETKRLIGLWNEVHGDEKVDPPADITERDIEDAVRQKIVSLDQQKRERKRQRESLVSNKDYMVRSIREELEKVVDRNYKKQVDQDKKEWNKRIEITQKSIEEDKAKTMRAMETFGQYMEDAEAFFKSNILPKREEDFKEKLEAFEIKKAKAKQKWEARREIIRGIVERRAARNKKNTYQPPKDTYQPPTDVYQPSGGNVYQPPRGDTYQAPRGGTYQPPRDDTYQVPRGDTYQAPAWRSKQYNRSNDTYQSSRGDVYQPPKNAYQPPKDVYQPPKNAYQPPKDVYQPPSGAYQPPKNAYPPSDGGRYNRKRSSRRFNNDGRQPPP